MEDEPKKRKRFRFGLGNAFGLRSTAELLKRQGGVTRDILDDVLPKEKITKRSFLGKERDGGVARFSRLARDLSEDELVELVFDYERNRTIYVLAGLAATLLIPISSLFGWATWFFIMGLCLTIIFFFVKALQTDFFAWRLRQRRMAPLAEYLNNRLPANVQIMRD